MLDKLKNMLNRSDSEKKEDLSNLEKALKGSLLTGAGGNGVIGNQQANWPQMINHLYYKNPNNAIKSPILDLDIVKINRDGSVSWKDGIKIDEAAEALTRSLSLGIERVAGVTQKVKSDMRDSIFNDLILITEKKGSLTVEDLTLILESSKIMEKLKGNREE